MSHAYIRRPCIKLTDLNFRILSGITGKSNCYILVGRLTVIFSFGKLIFVLVSVRFRHRNFSLVLVSVLSVILVLVSI